MIEKDSKDKKKIVAESIGDKPVNSRIFVDYNKTPPEIKFEYPDDNINQVNHSSLVYLIAMLLAVIVIAFLIIGWTYYLQYSIFPNSDEVYINNVTINKYPNLNNYTNINVEYTWMNESYDTIIRFQRQGQFWYYPSFYDIKNVQSVWYDIMPAVMVYGLIILLVFIFARLIGLLFYKTKWGHKSFPEWNKKLHDKKYSAEFFKDDVTPIIAVKPIGKNPGPDSDKMMSIDKWVVELPMFQNMYMDYEATGEFSKYLTKISIIEHPFNRYVKKKGKEMEKSRRQLRREERLARKNKEEFDYKKYDEYYNKKPNIYLWKCIFEFKQKPEMGYLRLWFT